MGRASTEPGEGVDLSTSREPITHTELRDDRQSRRRESVFRSLKTPTEEKEVVHTRFSGRVIKASSLGFDGGGGGTFRR